ncbi:MAG: uroporphyrinogen decarboxylase [Treponema sp.]|jgi:uroporphyrinogen decarboxylase|nr:uroporphyrinogen decarboxylase [Treponema sp.]
MNRRETVIAALNHRETRPVPYTLGLTGQALEKLVQYSGDPAVEGKLGSYMTEIYYAGRPRELPGRPGYFRDDFGVLWNRNGADKDIGVIDGLVIEDIEDNSYRFPPMDEQWLREELEKLCAAHTDQFRVADFGFTLFERCWTLMGMENVLAGMLTCPDALENFFDRLVDFWLPIIDIVLEYDVDAVQFGDDWGQQHGLIMGPDHWRRFIKPRLARLYGRVKSKGKFVLQHSCGDCREIFPDLIEIGLDCYQTFQPEIYDITYMKSRYGKNICFWGGISTQRCLPRLNPRGVQEEIVRVAKILSPGGGYILAPTHAVPGDVPPENILAMAEVFQHQEKFF